MQKFDTTAPVTALVDVPAGSLRFIASDRAETTVEVLPADSSKSRDVKAAEQTRVSFEGGVLRIDAPDQKQILGPSGTVEVVVQLPAGSRVEGKVAAGELRGVGRLGDVRFEGAQAVVKLDEAAGARITLQLGDVTIGRLTGDAEIATQKGDLLVTEAVRGALVLRTEHGGISVAAARGASATLDAGTAYGRVLNTLANAAGADAELSIRATTSYGDITARSL
ncbi:DUF4097 family beta strand repeat-containing protein [Kitasatospora sp. NPDC101183]|uniref:DUF4097 family beta strand repeat-containing protein n=1 Tax=Kitasatospora sp. NPDC101183 TaxID=3364100 RepID=UPI00381ECBA7